MPPATKKIAKSASEGNNKVVMNDFISQTKYHK